MSRASTPEDGPTYVHCPECGEAIALFPRVGVVVFNEPDMLIQFRPKSIKHECKERK